MAVSDSSPNADNYYKGTGIPYFKRTGDAAFRDMGSVATIEYTPSVQKKDHYIARGGKKQKDRTSIDQVDASMAITLEEYTAKNLATTLGGIQATAVDLDTTADTATSTALTNIASVTGLVIGRRYWVSGEGIAAGSSFIYGGGDDVTLDRATTATATGADITITCPVSFRVFAESQVTGHFIFVSDNDVGPRLIVEAQNVILTPSGALSLLNRDSDDYGSLEMTIDVYRDSYGGFTEFYWNTGDLDFVPAA